MFSRFTKRGSSKDEKKQSETSAVHVPVSESSPHSGANSPAHSERSSSGPASLVSAGQAGSSY
jgi:hypothetical protein